jgi:hypothetical protein
MAGYWNRHGETRSALFGETMKTGDKYLVDADSLCLWLEKDIMILKERTSLCQIIRSSM